MTSLIMMAAASATTAAVTPVVPSFKGFVFDAELGQFIALAVYMAVSAIAAVIATINRTEFRGVLSDKANLPAGMEGIAATAPTSFSRLAGLLGLLYLTAFFWGLGFFVLTYIWVEPDVVARVVSGSGQFLMAGSALFAPYAFNQLSQVFSTKTTDAKGQSAATTPTAMTSAEIAKALRPRG